MTDEPTAAIDRENCFLLFATFAGDIVRTSAASGVPAAAILKMCEEEGWHNKLAPILALKKSTKPGDLERGLNRALNYVQAHKMRLIVQRAIHRLTELTQAEFEEQIFAAGLEHAAGFQMIMVPFKGDSDGAIALAGGHIDVHVAVPVSYKNLEEARKVRILAIADNVRSPLYRNLPTFRENGVDLIIGAFHGVYVPKATPQAIIIRIADALDQAMRSKNVQMNYENAGAGLTFLRDAEGKDYLAKQNATYLSVIEKLGLRVTPSSK